MSDIKDIQKLVNRTFFEHFGVTPFRGRLEDIQRESMELIRYTDLTNLKEETGDLLSSLLQLCNEAGWDAESLVNDTITKIKSRSDQYKSLGRKLKVALLGGAFDPIHLGHVDVAKLVLNVAHEFDEVWITPCYKHLAGKNLTSAKHRLAMCHLAAKTDLRIKVFDYEIKYEMAGETYHFINKLKHDPDYSRMDFSFIISQDNANTYESWYNYEELERLIRFVVVGRRGYPVDPKVTWFHKQPHIFLRAEHLPAEISSTQIRNWLLTRDDKAKEFLDAAVYGYIQLKDLYLET
jgi:nicotinate-nucleotide adenylyltransferase